MVVRWDPEIRSKEPWTLKGELALSCNCTVFCRCVLSLGQHAPTEGYCQTRTGVSVHEARLGHVALRGIKSGFTADMPRRLARGDMPLALFIDDTAPASAVPPLPWIVSGRAGGS